MSVQPPKRALRLLRWFCREDYLDEIEGDITELFEIEYPEHPQKANRKCYWNVLRSFRWRNLKYKRSTHSINYSIMFKHYLKVAWRSILGRRAYAKLNILGLSIAFACSLLIYLWVNDELLVDHQHPDSDRVYNVYSRNVFEGAVNASRNTPAPLPAELVKVIPEIEYATGFARSFRLSLQGVTEETFQVGDVILKMKGSRGSADFFEVFGFELLYGSPSEALKDPLSIAISEQMAGTFFRNATDAIGKTIRYQDSHDLKVSAVFKDVDSRSSLQFDYLTNWEFWVQNDDFKPFWGHFGTQTYVKLAAGADPELVRDKVRDFLAAYFEFEDDFKIELDLQLFEDEYLFGEFDNGQPVEGRMIYVKAFRGVAIFILVIAFVNFINLVTATAMRRSKEIGVRKTIGAHGVMLKSQFILENFLITFIAFALSIGISWAVLPQFNLLAQKDIAVPFDDPVFWVGAMAFLIAISLLAGAYPSVVLSRVSLVSVQRSGSRRKTNLGRKSLIVFQFSLSILLIIVTLVVTRQTQYMRDTDLGFDRENLVYLPLEGEMIENYELFRSRASALPGVVMVDRSSQVPHDMGFSGPYANWEGKDPADQTSITPSSVGFDFIEAMKLEVLDGRGFSRDIVSDANSFVINETALKLIGPEAIGKRVRLFGKEGLIIGVVKDFHFNSLHSPIKPLFLDVKEDLNFATVLVRLEKGREAEGLAGLKTVHDEINPGYAFSYGFASEIYDRMYQAESTTTLLTQYFSGLAIFITCMGLFALVAHSTEQRIKEIGIRKVLGATVMNILNLISREFAFLLVLAAVLAVPVSYQLLAGWLDDFAYQIELGWALFALGFLTVLVTSLIIICSRVIKVALINPVGSLRND